MCDFLAKFVEFVVSLVVVWITYKFSSNLVIVVNIISVTEG